MRSATIRILLGLALCVSALNAIAKSAKAELLWLGQLAFRLTTPDGKVVMIDPWLRQNPQTPAQYKDMEKLGKIDLILVTYGHFDHISDAPRARPDAQGGFVLFG